MPLLAEEVKHDKRCTTPVDSNIAGNTISEMDGACPQPSGVSEDRANVSISEINSLVMSVSKIAVRYLIPVFITTVVKIK